mmetsp:Transcript_13203/g.28990  ORF Transcript_13203/g.28990 Transcript_13203/m.28990 type:complete len:586 (-) Transcript_13203:1475-3232(-)|eukprot:CAMPEP_0168743932 /NCGR_PEP_ID=MMETSP0724-20121128/13832_1 /TAXON_ID=265536 /ORGANISM="Amphiprora sp., Strain CCMP467" /LENGTH=585 /DNA_ID=CAMNT_0008791579 /DNA_START=61 /DNA_END=1818 /DNA_ORIENTATION=-
MNSNDPKHQSKNLPNLDLDHAEYDPKMEKTLCQDAAARPNPEADIDAGNKKKTGSCGDNMFPPILENHSPFKNQNQQHDVGHYNRTMDHDEPGAQKVPQAGSNDSEEEEDAEAEEDPDRFSLEEEENEARSDDSALLTALTNAFAKSGLHPSDFDDNNHHHKQTNLEPNQTHENQAAYNYEEENTLGTPLGGEMNSITSINVPEVVLPPLSFESRRRYLKAAKEIVKKFKDQYEDPSYRAKLLALYNNCTKSNKSTLEWAKQLYQSFDEKADRWLDDNRKHCLKVVYGLVDAWDDWVGDGLPFDIFEQAVVDVFEKLHLEKVLAVCLPMDRANCLYHMDNRSVRLKQMQQGQIACQLVVGMPYYCKYHLENENGQQDPYFSELYSERHEEYKEYFESYPGYKGFGSSTMNKRLYRILFSPALEFQNDPFFQALSMPEEACPKEVETQVQQDIAPTSELTGAQLRELQEADSEITIYACSCAQSKHCLSNKKDQAVEWAKEYLNDQKLDLRGVWKLLKTKKNVKIYKPRIADGVRVKKEMFDQTWFDDITDNQEAVIVALENTNIGRLTRTPQAGSNKKRKVVMEA